MNKARKINKAWQLALDQANEACQKDCVPVGAVVTLGDEIISCAHNGPNPWEHAEIIALEKAFISIGQKIRHASLYVTLEPCAMCCGAISLYKTPYVYFGAYDTKMGCVEHNSRVFLDTCFKPEVFGGFHNDIFSHMLKLFFKNKRKL